MVVREGRRGMSISMETQGAREPGLATTRGKADVGSLAVVVDALPVGVLVVDESGQIVLANDAAVDIFGWTADQLLRRPVEDLIPEEQWSSHRDHRAEYAKNPSVRRMDQGRLLRALRADGSMVVVDAALSPVVLDGIAHVVVTVWDMTERVDAEQVARREESWRAVLDDRMRIARDLHDSVIQDLFATGLTVANVMSASDETVTAMLERVAEQLDTAIRRLREAVFQLHAHFSPDDNFQWLVRDATRVLGFEPGLTVTGDLTALTSDLLIDIEVVLRECLSNVSRHAEASEAHITVEVGDEVVVSVADNGVGLEGGGRESMGTGFRSLEERARQRGGQTLVESSPGEGTTVVWRVPLPSR